MRRGAGGRDFFFDTPAMAPGDGATAAAAVSANDDGDVAARDKKGGAHIFTILAWCVNMSSGQGHVIWRKTRGGPKGWDGKGSLRKRSGECFFGFASSLARTGVKLRQKKKKQGEKAGGGAVVVVKAIGEERASGRHVNAICKRQLVRRWFWGRSERKKKRDKEGKGARALGKWVSFLVCVSGVAFCRRFLLSLFVVAGGGLSAAAMAAAPAASGLLGRDWPARRVRSRARSGNHEGRKKRKRDSGGRGGRRRAAPQKQKRGGRSPVFFFALSSAPGGRNITSCGRPRPTAAPPCTAPPRRWR